MQVLSQEPGPWTGIVTRATEGVCGLVSQDHWYKFLRLIQVLVDMEDKEKGGLYISNMESIKGFLVYVNTTYKYINPYIKGLHLIIDSWRPFRGSKE